MKPVNGHIFGECIGGDKLVVLTRGEAYDSVEMNPTGEFQTGNCKFHPGSSLLSAPYDLPSGVLLWKVQISMKQYFSILRLAVFGVSLLVFASFTAAHERDTFKIGDKYYLLTVGSLNEPFIVDNISGVDLRVAQLPGPAPETAGKATPITGLERTLKVELSAGDKKETLPFDPSDKTPGSYSANFIPTVQTTYSYRLFGTIESNSVDLTFTCVTGEVSESAEDNSPLKVSGSITRLRKVGAFGCPASKKVLGFPEPSLSSYELNESVQSLTTGNQAAAKQAATAQTLSIAGILCGLIGLGVAGIAMKRK